MKKLLYYFLFVWVLAVACTDDVVSPEPEVSNVEISGASPVGGKLQVTSGESVVFAVKCENTEISGYEWFVNDVSRSKETRFTFTAGERGTYVVKVRLTSSDNVSKEQEVGIVRVVDKAPVIEKVTFSDVPVEGSVDVVVGSPAKFTVTSTNVEILGYQWTVNGAVVEDAHSSTYQLKDSVGVFAVNVAVFNRDSVSASTGFTVNISGPYKEGLLFYGTTSEGLAFFNPRNEGTFYADNLFKTINGTNIGSGGVNDLYVSGNKLYLLTPTSASKRAQVVVCDAQTLVKQEIITADGFNPDQLGQIYNLVVVSKDKAYIGYNRSNAGNVSGVRVLDMKNKTFSATDIPGTGGKLGVEGPAWSRMLKTGKNIWVGCGSKLQVIDSTTDAVVKTIEIDAKRQITDIVKGRDGKVYALVAGSADKSSPAWLWGPSYTTPASVVCVDPKTFAYTEDQILIDGKKTDIGGGLENASACASLTGDEIFFKASGFSTSKVYRYNYKTKETSLFVSVDGSISKYMATDKDGYLYVPLVISYAYVEVSVYRISDGTEMKETEGKMDRINGDGGICSTYRFE